MVLQSRSIYSLRLVQKKGIAGKKQNPIKNLLSRTTLLLLFFSFVWISIRAFIFFWPVYVFLTTGL